MHPFQSGASHPTRCLLFLSRIVEYRRLTGLKQLATLVVVAAGGYWLTRELDGINQLFSYIFVGVGLLVSIQSLINIGVNMGALPTKGLTLPFISYGGNSILIMSFAIGLVLRVHYENVQPTEPPRRYRPGETRARWAAGKVVRRPVEVVLIPRPAFRFHPGSS